MSTNKINVDSLSSEIAKMFEEYTDEIDDLVKTETNSISKEAQQALKSISPKETGDYASSWTIVQGCKENRQISKRIWNKAKPSLTHLLEFGHVKKDGTIWVLGIPHIRPTEEKYKEKLVDNLERKIKR